MAFPPATLPVNRTNATPQVDTHPNDHNTIGAAINDTVGRVQAHDGQLAALGGQVADLYARNVEVFQSANPAVIPLTADAWGVYTVGTITIDRQARVLITVVGTIGSNPGGYCRLTGGVNGTQHPDGEGRGDNATATSLQLSHTFAVDSGPGSIIVDVFGLAQYGGGLGPCFCSAVITPT